MDGPCILHFLIRIFISLFFIYSYFFQCDVPSGVRPSFCTHLLWRYAWSGMASRDFIIIRTEKGPTVFDRIFHSLKSSAILFVMFALLFGIGRLSSLLLYPSLHEVKESFYLMNHQILTHPPMVRPSRHAFSCLPFAFAWNSNIISPSYTYTLRRAILWVYMNRPPSWSRYANIFVWQISFRLTLSFNIFFDTLDNDTSLFYVIFSRLLSPSSLTLSSFRLFRHSTSRLSSSPSADFSS